MIKPTNSHSPWMPRAPSVPPGILRLREEALIINHINHYLSAPLALTNPQLLDAFARRVIWQPLNYLLPLPDYDKMPPFQKKNTFFKFYKIPYKKSIFFYFS